MKRIAQLRQESKKRGWYWNKRFWIPFECLTDRDSEDLSRKLKLGGYFTSKDKVEKEYAQKGASDADYYKSRIGKYLVWRSVEKIHLEEELRMIFDTLCDGIRQEVRRRCLTALATEGIIR